MSLQQAILKLRGYDFSYTGVGSTYIGMLWIVCMHFFNKLYASCFSYKLLLLVTTVLIRLDIL